jgi:hypothetical protein
VKDDETRGWHRLSLRDVGQGDRVSVQGAVEKKNVPRKYRRSLVGKLRFSRESPSSDKGGAARRQRLWRRHEPQLSAPADWQPASFKLPTAIQSDFDAPHLRDTAGGVRLDLSFDAHRDRGERITRQGVRSDPSIELNKEISLGGQLTVSERRRN